MHTPARIAAIVIIGLIALFLLTVPGAPAQSQDDDQSSTQSGPDQNGGTMHTVRLRDIEFVPNRVKLKPGDRVRFVNKDSFKHDVYLVNAANPNDVLVPARILSGGETITVPIDREGLFQLYCTIHGGMSGKVTTTGSFELTEEQKKAAAKIKVVPPIAKDGEDLFWGRAQCHQCHRIGERGDGTRGPDLSMIGFRAKSKAERLGLDSATAYLTQSLREPSAHIVEGFSDDMPYVYQPPINLSIDDLTAIIAYLQSQGGEVDTWSISIDEGQLASAPAYNPFAIGDPKRGREVFLEFGCDSCHPVGDHPSVSPGPDLTEIGAYRPWTWLAQSIFDPNAEIGANWKYATTFVQSTGGYGGEEMVAGILRKNTEDQVVMLIDSNERTEIDGERVNRVEIQKESKMPTNFPELFTVQQTADLIEYLRSLRGEWAISESPSTSTSPNN